MYVISLWFLKAGRLFAIMVDTITFGIMRGNRSMTPAAMKSIVPPPTAMAPA